MSFGANLFRARKKAGLSQEESAGRLGVSRQTVSKWELDETLPDIRQAKKLSSLYRMTLDELVNLDIELEEIEQAVRRTTQEQQARIDWTRLWGEKYPVLTTYRKEVDTGPYAAALGALLERLSAQYGYGRQDAFLVLKDILAQVWNGKKKAEQ